ncbi:liprin-beta homolog isoform X2 [Athalia rosae]|uniref:liprin-beta homolog isoform X2 n=1 Tax=Athalia rosae TaxID=37344 RepID=UPI0020340595|nr:liprin-beta homolog isoform X2 [Athalia rosae]
MSHDKIKTILPPRMDIRPNNSYRPWLPNPTHLFNLAGDLVNDLPKPVCWEWDVHDVAKWLRKEVGLPEYKNCFIKNFINGRRLLRVDASVCPMIGIQDLSHTKLKKNLRIETMARFTIR